MQIIEPSFQLWSQGQPLTPQEGQRLLSLIEHNARISHRAEDKQTDESWQRFIKSVVIDRGDWSVTEHANITAELIVDRGITHELVRHRHFSFTQESTRFVRYGEKNGLSFIKPVVFKENPDFQDENWLHSLRISELTYFDLLDKGFRPQEARSILPNAFAAKISMTSNLRNWRWFFLMRTSKETHPDMREVTIPMLAEFKQCIPLLFDDITPLNRQIDNLRLPK